jgi:O-antigen/teichoic acid export membrane protein
MGVIIRQSLKSTIVQYAGIALGYLNMAILFPALFSREQIGLIAFLISTTYLLMPIVQLGVSNIIIKFYPRFKKENKTPVLNTLALLIPLFSFIIIAGVLIIGKEIVISRFYSGKLLVEQYYILLIPFIFFVSQYMVWSSISRVNLRIVVPNFIDKILIRSLFLVGLVAVWYGVIGFDQYVYLHVFSFGAGLIILIIYVRSSFPLKMNFNFKSWHSVKLSELLTFGSLSVLTAVGAGIVNNIDVIMLSSMKTLTDTGIYKIAFFIGAVIDMPLRSVGQISSPIIARAWHARDLDTIKTIYSKSSLNLMLIGSFIFILIWVNVGNIYSIIPNGHLFSDGVYVILFIGIGKLFNMSLGSNGEIIGNSKYYYVNFISLLFLAVITIVTNLIFIPKWGITGAAFASALSIVIFNVIKFLFIFLKFRMQPFSFNTIKGIGIILLTLLIGRYLPLFNNPFLDLIVRGILICALFLPLTYFLHVSEDLNRITNLAIGKLKTLLNR